MAAAALGERLGTEGIVGGGLILAGVLVSELSGGATSEPAHASGRGPG
jgi:drug/metabolite transporter (DMT)-like permease